jgi:drug/metabolite transporter (DMT)-like permease
MPVIAAYLGVVLIWSTTPLAIKWSGEGAGFLFGVASRMSIGALVCLLLMLLLRKRLPLHRQALKLYLAGAVAGYGSMLSVYWGATYIPSGWISVLFGLTPMMTSLFAYLWLKEEALTAPRVLGMLLAVAGLWVIFDLASQNQGDLHELGIVLVLVAAFLHSISSVWVKAVNTGLRLPALAQTTGTLVLIVPLFWLTWALLGPAWPSELAPRTLGSIAYLGVVGSVLGFILYYYTLQHVSASRVALITVLTPVGALLLGSSLNDEELGPRVWSGSALILMGLVLYQWGRRLLPGRI